MKKTILVLACGVLAAGASEGAVNKLCKKGYFSETIRSHSGKLCEDKIVAIWGNKYCKGTGVGYEQSKCYTLYAKDYDSDAYMDQLPENSGDLKKVSDIKKLQLAE